MSQTIQQKQIEYFTRYAGSCLKIWSAIVGQQITHSDDWTGTVVGIKKIDGSIEVEVQSTEGQRHWNSPTKKFRFGKERNLSEVFTHLTLPREVEKESLIYELRNLASHSSIDQSTSNTFYEIYNRLMIVNQKRKLPEKTIQEINGYLQIFRSFQLMDREKQFSNLSEKAMNLNVRARFPAPELNEDDIQLVVGEWYKSLNNLDRKSLMENNGKNWKLGRLLSARSAEKIAIDFYRNYGLWCMKPVQRCWLLVCVV